MTSVNSRAVQQHQNNRLTWLDWLLVTAVALFIYLLIIKFPGTPIVYEGDQLIFVYEGGRILQGDVMYRDFFEFTFPGTQAFYALILFLVGQKYWILPATVIGIGVVNSVILIKISKILIPGAFRYLPPVLFMFFGFRWFGIDGSHRMMSPLFILLVILVLLKGQKPFHYVLAGTFCGFASFFTQQRGLAMMGAILIFLTIEVLMRDKDLKKALRSAYVLGISFALTITVLCSYFIFAGGWDNFLYSTFTQFPFINSFSTGGSHSG